MIGGGRPGNRRGEVLLQLRDLRSEILDHAARVPQHLGGDQVGARSPAQSQVDAARVERLQRAELLGDDEGWVVRQQHPAGTDPDGGGGRRDLAR